MALRPRRPAGVWGAFLAIALIQVAWAVALPGWLGPDEIEHVKRASAVAGGELVSGSDTNPSGHQFVTVELDVAEALRARCVDLHQDLQPESCEPAADAGPGRVAMPSTAAGYHPAYYLLVAPASWALEGDATLWGIRLIGAAVSTVLLARAWSRRARTATRRWQGVGLMLCLTPAVTFAGIVGAPNGIHLAAALLLWTALVSRTGSAAPGCPDRGRGRDLGIAATLMVLTHALGVFWLVCSLAVMCLWKGRAGIREAVGDLRSASLSTSAAATATVTVLAWGLLVPSNDNSVVDPLAASTKEIPAFAHAIVWVFQLVGTMPYRFGLVWPVVYALWIAAVLSLVWSAVRQRDVRTTVSLSATLVVAAAIPVVVTALTYDRLGFAWQGRYELPLLFAVTLVAGDITRGFLPRLVVAADVVVGGAGLALCLAVACLALRQEVALGGVGIAVVAAGGGWWCAWWVLRMGVGPGRPVGPPSGDEADPSATADPWLTR